MGILCRFRGGFRWRLSDSDVFDENKRSALVGLPSPGWQPNQDVLGIRVSSRASRVLPECEGAEVGRCDIWVVLLQLTMNFLHDYTNTSNIGVQKAANNQADEV